MDFYDKHYIRVEINNDREEKYIVYGFSNAFEDPLEDDILINAEGGRQFQLKFPDGTLSEENPPLRDEYGVLLYRWDDGVVERPGDELEADRLPEPEAEQEEPTGIDPLEGLLGRIERLEESVHSQGLQLDQLNSSQSKS